MHLLAQQELMMMMMMMNLWVLHLNTSYQIRTSSVLKGQLLGTAMFDETRTKMGQLIIWHQGTELWVKIDGISNGNKYTKYYVHVLALQISFVNGAH